MDNANTHKVTSEGAPSIFCLHLVNGIQYLVPFICQRCGNCCRVAFDAPCQHLREPNVCLIYDRRPSECLTFPVYTGDILANVVCKGYQLSQKAITILSHDIDYWIGCGSSDIFKATEGLRETIDKFERGNLPREFIDRFIDLNS